MHVPAVSLLYPHHSHKGMDGEHIMALSPSGGAGTARGAGWAGGCPQWDGAPAPLGAVAILGAEAGAGSGLRDQQELNVTGS